MKLKIRWFLNKQINHKKFKKVLDKGSKVCYTIEVKRGSPEHPAAVCRDIGFIDVPL